MWLIRAIKIKTVTKKTLCVGNKDGLKSLRNWLLFLHYICGFRKNCLQLSELPLQFHKCFYFRTVLRHSANHLLI